MTISARYMRVFLSAFLIFLAAIFLTTGLPFYIVSPGFTALQIRLGKIVNASSDEGLYLKMPFIDRVVYIDTRINKAEIETKALSKDLQTVDVGMVVNYKINNPLKIYQNIGTNFVQIIIDPFTQESVKAVIAKFTAEDLIQSRHEAKDKVISELKARLEPQYISLIDFNFIHLDFSPDFIHAVEEKQIAEQSAKTAKNLTEKVKEEVLQARARAEAEAFALKVKRENVTSELIALKQVEANIKAIEKWNGVLPTVTGNNIPLLSLRTGENNATSTK